MPSLDDAIGGVPTDPLDAAIDGVGQDNARLRTSLYGAVKQNPDEVARAAQLARKTGLPTPMVQRNLPQIEQRDALDSLDAAIEKGSAVDRKLSDAEFAAMAHDDVGTLSGVEALLKSPPVPALTPDYGFGQASQDLRREQDAQRAKLDAFFRPRSTVSTSRGPAPSFSSVMTGLGQSFVQGAERATQGVRLQFADTFGLDEMAADAIKKRARAQFRQDLTTPEFESSTGAGLYGGGASLLQNLPGMIASIITRNPAPALAAAGTQTELDAYGRYRSRGATPGEAALGAGGEGLVEVGTELIPLRTMLGAFGHPGSTAAKEFLKSQVQEQFGEQVATVLQDALDTAVANPNKTWGQYLAERPDAAYQTALATLVTSGAMTAGHVAVSKLAGEGARADAATRDAEVLAKMAQLATASKLRARDPKTFQDFVEAANENGPVQDVYLDARTLQQSGVDVAALAQASPAVAAQIQEATATGGDIVIPTAEYAAKIAGTDLDAALVPHLRTSEDGLSLDEAQRFYQGQTDQFKAAAAQAMEEHATDEAFKTSAKEVETKLFDDLKQTGRFTDDVNKAYATLGRDFYVATAARLGITPTEMFSRYPLKMAVDRITGGQRMEQEQTAAEAAGFDTSTEWLHGTTAKNFRAFKPGKGGVNELGPGVYFTKHEMYAKTWARGENGRVIRTYLKRGDLFDYGKPVDYLALARRLKAHNAALSTDASMTAPNETLWRTWLNESDEGLAAHLKNFAPKGDLNTWLDRAGYIGAVDANSQIPDQVVVFDPKNIRSVDAKFDPAKADSANIMAQSPKPNLAQRVMQAVTNALGVTQAQPEAPVDNGVAPLDMGQFFQGQAAVDQTETPEFKRWFGDSKVVDADGKPLVVMHASTYGDITEFNKSEQRFGKAGYGFYFSDASGSNLFAEYGQRFQMDRSAAGEQKAVKTYPVYLSLKNPLIVDHVDDLKQYVDVGQKFGVARGVFGNLPPDALMKLQRMGYDGIITRETTAPKVHKSQGLKILDRNDPKAVSFPVYVAFEPTQIKSAIGNRGTFDPADPNILNQGQGNRAEISFAKDITSQPSVITLFKNADLSSFLHEMGHFQLEVLAHIASQPSAPAEIAQDLDAVFKWFGITGSEQTAGGETAGALGQSGFGRFGELGIKKEVSRAAAEQALAGGEVVYVGVSAEFGTNYDPLPSVAALRFQPAGTKFYVMDRRGQTGALVRDAGPTMLPTARASQALRDYSSEFGKSQFITRYRLEELKKGLEKRVTESQEQGAAARAEAERWARYAEQNGIQGEPTPEQLTAALDLGLLPTDAAFVATAEEAGQRDAAKYQAMLAEVQSFLDEMPAEGQFKTGQAVTARVFHGSNSANIAEEGFRDDMLGSNTKAKSATMGFFFAGRPETSNAYVDTPDRSIYDLLTRDEQYEVLQYLTDDMQDREAEDRLRGDDDLTRRIYEDVFNKAAPEGPSATLYPARVHFGNPYVHDYQGEQYREVSYAEVISKAKRAGHDGVILLNTYDGGPIDNIFVAFEKGQIEQTLYQGDDTTPKPASLPPGRTPLEVWQAMSLEEKRPYHEQFARGFEAYLFEGRAPSTELNGVFARFRAWLVNVYKSVKALNVEINDEIRGVFDRLVATDEAIKQAEAARSMLPLFKSEEEMGDAELWAAYQRTGAQATEDAVSDLQRRGLRDMQWLNNARGRILKQLQADAKAKRQAVEDEVKAEVRAMPVYAAQHFLKRGEMTTAEGEQIKVEKGHRLDTGALAEMYPESMLARPPIERLHGMTRKDGLHPDLVAQMFGFTSGDHLVRDILAATPEAEMVEGMTDQRVLERYGDLDSPDALARAADEAVHNEARARFVATELKALSKATGPVRAIAKAARDFAEATIARKKVKDIKPRQHAAAETRAAKAAEKAMAAGDTAAAAVEKRNQLVQNYSARAAYDALDEVGKAVKYLKKFDSEGTRKGLDPDYVEQIDAMLERFDLRASVSNKDAAKRAKLADWIKAQEAQGFEPVISDALREEAFRTPYRELSLEELRGLVDAVKNIEHLGRLKKKLLTAADQRDFDAAASDVVGSIKENAKGSIAPQRSSDRSLVVKVKALFRHAAAIHRKFASLVREFDGFKDGGKAWEYLVRNMNDRGNFEAVENEKATVHLAGLLDTIKHVKMREKQYFESIGRSYSREERIGIALNMGNETNTERVLTGERLSPAQLQEVLDTLSKEETDFVQGVWDFIASYKPQMAEKERRLTGVEPQWVEPTPWVTKHGTYPGGYYPIAYDPLLDERSSADINAEVQRQLERGLYVRAQTRRGHLKERSESTGRPLRFDFGDVITRHVTQVVHDLAWHEYLIDANRLLRDPAIQQAIREHYGPEVYTELKDTLKDIAVGSAGTEKGAKFFNHLRYGTTIASLGFNVFNTLQNLTGITQSFSRVGTGWVLKGAVHWAGDAASMESSIKQIHAKSDFMRLRAKTMLREINDIRNKVSGNDSRLQAAYFWLQNKTQLMVDVPTWWGAYEKAMAQDDMTESKAVALADQAVIDAQGSGQTKDLAGIQRGSSGLRLLTTFYSFFNTTFNLTAEAYGRTDFKKPGDVAMFTADMVLLYALPALLSTLLKAALRDDWDDPEALARKAAGDQVSYLMGTVVGLREMGAGAQAAAGVGEGFGYSGPASLRFFSDFYQLGTQIQQGELDEAFWKSLNNELGVIFHYPAGQINRTATGIAALLDGRTDNPAAVVMGAPPKQ